MDSDVVAAWFCGDRGFLLKEAGGVGWHRGQACLSPHKTLPGPTPQEGVVLDIKAPLPLESCPLPNQNLVVMKPDLSPLYHCAISCLPPPQM